MRSSECLHGSAITLVAGLDDNGRTKESYLHLDDYVRGLVRRGASFILVWFGPRLATNGNQVDSVDRHCTLNLKSQRDLSTCCAPQEVDLSLPSRSKLAFADSQGLDGFDRQWTYRSGADIRRAFAVSCSPTRSPAVNSQQALSPRAPSLSACTFCVLHTSASAHGHPFVRFDSADRMQHA